MLKVFGELWPDRNQWSRWSLPNKLTALGFLVGVASLALGLVAFLEPALVSVSISDRSNLDPIHDTTPPFKSVVVVSEAELAVEEPHFASDFAPGECGFGRIFATGSLIVLRQAPTRDAKVVARARPTRGQELGYSESRYRTAKPAEVIAKTSFTLLARRFGDIRHLSDDLYYADAIDFEEVEIVQGETFQYLQYRAGFLHAHRDGACLHRQLRHRLVHLGQRYGHAESRQAGRCRGALPKHHL